MFILFSITVILFSFVLLFGAPYLPTRRKQTEQALDLLDLKKGQTLYELGCGDGRVLKIAAEHGLACVGYELNPLLVLIAKIHTWKYRRLITIHWKNFWHADVSKADGIYVFLLDRFMEKLDTKMTKEVKKPTLLVSYAFQIPGKEPKRKKGGLFLYRYGD